MGDSAANLVSVTLPEWGSSEKQDNRGDGDIASPRSVVSVTFHRATKEIPGSSLEPAPRLSALIDDNKERSKPAVRSETGG